MVDYALLCTAAFWTNILIHDVVKIGLVDDCAGLRALGLLLEILAEEVKIELAFFNLWASLQPIPDGGHVSKQTSQQNVLPFT
jgi:hypothetical protein